MYFEFHHRIKLCVPQINCDLFVSIFQYKIYVVCRNLFEAHITLINHYPSCKWALFVSLPVHFIHTGVLLCRTHFRFLMRSSYTRFLYVYRLLAHLPQCACVKQFQQWEERVCAGGNFNAHRILTLYWFIYITTILWLLAVKTRISTYLLNQSKFTNGGNFNSILVSYQYE